MRYLVRIVLVFAVFSAALWARASDALPAALLPEPEIAFAKEHLNRLKLRDFDHVKALIDPSIQHEVTDELLDKMSRTLYPGEPLAVEVVGSQIQVRDGQWSGNFTFDYQYAEGWLLASTALKKVDDGYRVIGFSVRRTTASQRELNAFRWAGLSPLHYAALVCEVFFLLFMLVSFVTCLRTKMIRRKWLWAIATLIGWGSFQFNWASGVLAYQWLSFQIIGMGATKAGPAAPWILATTLPVGAMLFWLRRPKLIAAYRARQASEAGA